MTTSITTPPKSIDTLLINGASVTLVQYLVLNLFRVMRPIRVKYNLTINEIIFLSAVLTYHKLYDSIFSSSKMRQHIGYFNLNKYNYYLGSMLKKGCIIQSDVVNGTPRYKLTEYGLMVLDKFQDNYDSALMKFISDHNIMI